jgi:hypothetical protein
MSRGRRRIGEGRERPYGPGGEAGSRWYHLAKLKFAPGQASASRKKLTPGIYAPKEELISWVYARREPWVYAREPWVYVYDRKELIPWVYAP